MGKFKVGDEVRRTSYFDESIARGRYFRGEAFKIAMVNYHGGIVDPDGMTHSPQYLEHVAEAKAPIKSPIRTVTRRELVPGEYGSILVDRLANGGALVMLGFKTTGNIFPDCRSLFSANELRSAAMVLSQLAEFLDEDKGGE